MWRRVFVFPLPLGPAIIIWKCLSGIAGWMHLCFCVVLVWSKLVVYRVSVNYRFWSRHSHCSWLDQKRSVDWNPIYYSGQIRARFGQVRASPGKSPTPLQGTNVYVFREPNPGKVWARFGQVRASPGKPVVGNKCVCFPWAEECAWARVAIGANKYCQFKKRKSLYTRWRVFKLSKLSSNRGKQAWFKRAPNGSKQGKKQSEHPRSPPWQDLLQMKAKQA